jgi:membrane-bound lytic murein transglycosylase A
MAVDGPVDRGLARWWPVAWSDLPGFDADRLLQAWPALAAGCTRPPRAWAALCARLAAEPPVDEVAAQAFVRTHLQPFRVEDAEGRDRGLITGYYEPQLDAHRQPDAHHRVPLYALPGGLRDRSEPWFYVDTMAASLIGLRPTRSLSASSIVFSGKVTCSRTSSGAVL